MNVTFEKKDELNGTISVNVSSSDYTADLDKRLKDYQKKATIPGFRPGMAPKGMIEKMVGTSMLLEAVNAMASKGLFDYIDDNKLNILGQPVLNEDSKIDELSKGKDYVFRFDIGLSPEFELNISENDVFTRYEVTISDEMINDEVDRMTKRFGNLHNVEEAGDNDVVYASMDELDEQGNAVDGGVHAASVPVLTSSIKNEVAKAQILGCKPGQVLQVNVFDLFDHNESEIAHALGINKLAVADLGKSFRFTVNEIKRNEPATINQELFDKAYGEGNVTTEEELRNRIREELKSYFEGQADHLFEHELTDNLVAKHHIPLPDEFLKRWLLDRYADKFNAENVDHGYLHEAEYLRNHLFEEKVMRENNIQVNEDDIRQAAMNYTRSMFGAYGNTGISDDMLAGIVEPSLKKEDYRSRMINIAVSNKVRDILKQKVGVSIQEISSEDFFKIVAEHNEKHHAHNH